MAGLLSPANWFTPSSLFLLLNLVIVTIVLVSRFTPNRKPPEEIRSLARAPSLIERVRSINLSFHKYSPFDSEMTTEYVQSAESSVSTTTRVDNPPPLERAPSFIDRLKSVNLSSLYRSEPGVEADSDETSGTEVEHQVKSKTEARVGLEKKASGKMKKSASEKAVVVVEEEDRESVERRRPQTTRLEKTESFGDDGVDAKADDFINRFKQQLRLQRLDSLLRYRNMITGN